MDCSPPGSFVHGDSPGKNTGVGCQALLQRIFPTQVSSTVADSLPAEPPGKSKNTGVGSLSLLQRIFPTQESNWGLLHCRWTLYQLSYQGSPPSLKPPGNFDVKSQVSRNLEITCSHTMEIRHKTLLVSSWASY